MVPAPISIVKTLLMDQFSTSYGLKGMIITAHDNLITRKPCKNDALGFLLVMPCHCMEYGNSLHYR
jgi:hypothetical protein